ncbi:hypothetical protein ACSLPG_37060, partial [Escherichia coli]|uniref:hypothetical protein n=1 Tax=Escherichia coli TaxID=562 RepID=UPI003EE13B50
TYNAVLIKSTGTTASNIDQTVNTSWGGLQATDATHAYDLSAEVSLTPIPDCGLMICVATSTPAELYSFTVLP